MQYLYVLVYIMAEAEGLSHSVVPIQSGLTENECREQIEYLRRGHIIDGNLNLIVRGNYKCIPQSFSKL